MEAKLKDELRVSFVKAKGFGGSGCISEGQVFETENGLIFVKVNNKSKAKLMFDGEFAGLNAIKDTMTVQVPNPLKVVELGSHGTGLVMEYAKIGKLCSDEKFGKQLAQLHQYNASLQSQKSVFHSSHQDSSDIYIDKFGFHCTTCCGYIPQENSWKSDWVEFFAQNRLDLQVKLVQEKDGNREIGELWSRLSLVLPSFFKDIEIEPALLHGDLWSGNVGEANNEPIIYDPATFYGHSEYDLGIAKLFGGFSPEFYNAYHSVIPKTQQFNSRQDLYKLFHNLNHWNHFGGGYKNSSLSLMKKLLKTAEKK